MMKLCNQDALKYLDKAANYGHVNAQRMLSLIYLNKKKKN